MHADFDELSDLAAGRRQPGDHVAACRDCLAELARIRELRDGLAALPVVPAPPQAWAGAQARHARRRVAPPLPTAKLAMAASLLLMLGAAMLFAALPDGARVPERPALVPPPLDGLVRENARLEAMLAGLPRTSTTRVGTAYTVAALEDRLALLDDRITTVALQPHAPETAEQLWRERVTLMNSLVQVQYANLVASR